ncbi:MAG: alpha-galactosidase [Eubacterium sp.]|nr:alpha-galactosidase [Eubacterium sp.]
MIQFDEKTNVFKLDTKNLSYVIGLADGAYAGHIYFGKRLESTDLSYLLRIDEPPFVPSANLREKVAFLDSYPMEYAFGGTGDFRESCITVTTAAGQQGLDLTYVSHRIYNGKEALDGLPATWGTDSETLELTLEDIPTGIRVLLSYSIFSDSDAVMRSVKIINGGADAIYIDRVLSACLDMDNEQYEVLSLHGSWARERHMNRTPLGYGSYTMESVRGESSHQDHPFLALVSPGCTQTSGSVYAMHFIYSGNFLAKAQLCQHDTVRMVMGIHPEQFRWKLEPGECFQAPEVVCVYSDEGLGKMTRTFHDLYRNHLIRSKYKYQPRPVLVNSWEAAYFDFDTEKLLKLAKQSAELGIEMLVMDDGWFGHRNSDEGSLGDWYVNEEKLKGGLKYLVDEVNALGMKFGIWLEPEMISPDSDVYRAHPEWALQLKNRTASLCRAQYVLDLSRPEVVDYVYDCVRKTLQAANISYVKWDMNRQLTDIGSTYLPADRQGELSHRHTLAVYELQERMLQEFPDLLLENCSGGGARFDPGMLYYSPQIWCSDNTDAVERLIIQEGTQLIYPLSVIGAHVSDCPNHTVGRVTPFETRGVVALAGTFGYELDPCKISEDDRKKIPGQIADYKKYGALVREGDYYRIASYQENRLYDCYEIVSKDREEAVVFFIQVLHEPNRRSRKIYLQGLDADAVYLYDKKEYLGATLMQAGLILPRMWGDFQAQILEFKKK